MPSSPRSFAFDTITLWQGSVANIPNGWTLCDGTAGTPDLRDQFIVGAGNAYAPDDTHDRQPHIHQDLSAPHAHDVQPGAPATAGGPNFSAITTATAVSMTTDPSSAIAPYYALCYIMQV